tara:strand:- start:15240 stop:15572 length:333 start_codon:yes stop_codon:yes gene_type:complete
MESYLTKRYHNGYMRRLLLLIPGILRSIADSLEKKQLDKKEEFTIESNFDLMADVDDQRAHHFVGPDDNFKKIQKNGAEDFAIDPSFDVMADVDDQRAHHFGPPKVLENF